MDHIVSQLMILIATIDPFGTLTLFVGLTAGATAVERRRIAFRAIAYAGLVLLGFILAGQLVLASIDVRLEAFQLAGGIVFFLFGVQMVFGTGAAASPAPAGQDAAGEGSAGHDLAVFPLAVPSIASPGSILAVVVLTDNREFPIAEQAVTAGLLCAVLLGTCGLLLAADRVHRWLGDAGSNLLVRVMGLILTAIAVEMVLEALVALASDFR